VTRAETSYRSLVDILPVGFFRSNTTVKFTYVNNVFANLVDRTAESLEGVEFNKVFYGESSEKLKHTLSKVITSNTTVEVELPIYKDGIHQRTLLCVATPLYDQYGKPEGVQSVLLDVTHQKQIQADKEASNTLGTLQSGLSTMANELNNALAPILLDAENLRDSDLSGIPKDTIDRIESSVQKARSVLRPFLVSTQKVGPRSELLDAHKIILHSLADVKNGLPAYLKLETSLPKRLKSVQGDASLLHKMLVNVLKNASESMAHQGLISVGAGLELLDVTSDTCLSLDLKPGEYLHITIRDQGQGIAPHLVQRVFEPFYTTKEDPHTGVGLTETLGIVKSHYGNLRLVSEPSSGTNFHIYLPVTDNETRPAAKNKYIVPAVQSAKGKNLILFADDEDNIIKSASLLLRHKGYKVISASNGAEALSKFSEHQAEIGLVITDFSMPVMDGPALIKAIRQISPSVSIVLCTGMETQDSCDEISELDINGTIFKPFRGSTLAEIVATHMS
jgi:PAS domain S-box-containing protein